MYVAVPAVAVAVAALGAGCVYGMWKWDNCCRIASGDQLEGSIYFCRHGNPYKLGGLRWWARPAWMRITQNTAMHILISRVEEEANSILEVSRREI